MIRISKVGGVILFFIAFIAVVSVIRLVESKRVDHEAHAQSGLPKPSMIPVSDWDDQMRFRVVQIQVGLMRFGYCIEYKHQGGHDQYDCTIQ